MNYLAHLFLSCDDEDLMIGNFIADSISNRDLPQFSTRIQEGIALHRKIDSYTDQHPIVRQGTARLHPYHHKYASVIIDVYFDFLLVRHWEKYSEIDLSAWTSNVYAILTNRIEDMPAKLQRNLPHMIADNWLVRYGTREGLDFTFSRIQKRVSKPELFANATQHLISDLPFLDVEFNTFFPEVIAYVEEECLC